MDESGKRNIKVRDKRRDIYYEYMQLNNLDEVYHLVHVDSDEYNFLIPNYYSINYSQSNNTYETNGHIYFYNSKNKYTLDYTKKEYNSYLQHMSKLNNYVVKKFNNYLNREFVELYKNDIDYIYMYYNGYYYKIYGDHKLSLNEYYDMYFILFSITKDRLGNLLNRVKELYYFNKFAIKLLCDDIDILTCDLSKYIDDIDLVSSDITLINDNEYLKYKETKNKVEKLSINILSNTKENKVNVELDNDTWYINGIFDFGILGNYYNSRINDYNEVTQSDELSNEDKNYLLNKIVFQKLCEINSYDSLLQQQLIEYITKYLSDNLTYELWDKYHIREFVNTNSVIDYSDELDDMSIYKLFIDNLSTNKNIFNIKSIKESILGEELNIYPVKYDVKFTGLNGLIDSIKLEIDENYSINFNSYIDEVMV